MRLIVSKRGSSKATVWISFLSPGASNALEESKSKSKSKRRRKSRSKSKRRRMRMEMRVRMRK